MSKNKDDFNILDESTWPKNKMKPIYELDELSEEELSRILRLEEFFSENMRIFYNSIVSRDQQVPPGTEFYRVARVMSASHVFLIDSFAQGIYFSFCGTDLPVPMAEILGAFFEFAAQPFKEDSPVRKEMKEMLKFDAIRNKGYFRNKVLCFVQNKPTKDFLVRDELTISLDDPFFLKWAGSAAYTIVYFLEDTFHVDSITIKIINKANNPKAYKCYKRLKQIMEKVDDMRVIGL